MLNRRVLGGFIVVAMVLAAALPAAAVDIPLRNWSAPPTWTAPASSGGGRTALATTQGYPVPFIPVAPCRVMDTRGLGQTGAFGTPTIGANVTRTVPIPTHPTCTGILSSASAYSLNVTVTNTGSGVGGYLQLWPTGQAQPTSSNLNYPGPGSTLANAVVVAAGSAGSINVFSGNASADVIIDINGYYAWNISNSAGGFEAFTSTNYYAVFGSDSVANGIGVWGQANNGTGAIGVLGQSFNGVGVKGSSTGTTGATYGVQGGTASTGLGSAGVQGTDSSGVPTGFDVYGASGVVGGSNTGTAAVLGIGRFSGAAGGRFVRLNSVSPYTAGSDAYLSPGWGSAAWLYGDVGIYANAVSSASGSLYVAGSATVVGSMSKGSGTFKIDHPLDPENKYLYHSFVESPDMMNIYNGVVALDATGSAVVPLPTYFEALNRDFRYQLTSIGSRQPGLFIQTEVANNAFVISGGQAHGKVSWQVTGVRQDPFANAHRVVPEVVKEPELRGYYLHPAEYNQPAAKDLTLRSKETMEAAEAKATEPPKANLQ